MDYAIVSILSTIHRYQPLTRRAVCDRLGMSLNRVVTLVSGLIERQLVIEEISPDGAPGRPAAALSLNPGIGRVVGLDIGANRSRAVLSDAAGHALATVVQPTRAVPDRAVILEDIVRLVETVCQQGEVRPEQLLALCVGVQGIVDTRAQVVLDWPNMPAWVEGWKGLHLPGELNSRLGVEPVWVEDTARAMAMAAHRLGAARGRENFLYVFLGNGIGSGIFINGRLYAGSRGIAGELGHITVDEQGPWCSCGNRGCLEVMASTSAVLRRASERLAGTSLMSTLRQPYEQNALTLAALIEAAHERDKLAFQILDETGIYIGQVLATALNVLGLDLVVLGGPLAQSDDIILEAVRRQVKLHALPHISQGVQIVCDDQGEMAGAHGAALLALDGFFSSEKHLRRLLSVKV